MGNTFNNIRSVAVKSQVQVIYVKERVRFVELSFSFQEGIYLYDGVHLSGKGAGILRDKLVR